MKTLIRLEELAFFIAPLLFIPLTGVELSWWLWLLLFFAPDVAMVGYLAGNKAGAVLYNLAHHRAVAIATGLAGYYAGIPALLAAGLLLLAHSSFDRLLGYGLKYFEGFSFTHLGRIGKEPGRDQ